MKLLQLVLAWTLVLAHPPAKRDERGLSQSTENAILLAGAFIVAGLIVYGITTFVTGKLNTLTP